MLHLQLLLVLLSLKIYIIQMHFHHLHLSGKCFKCSIIFKLTKTCYFFIATGVVQRIDIMGNLIFLILFLYTRHNYFEDLHIVGKSHNL